MTRLFFFAGEKSGDLHGGHLIQSLKLQVPEIEIEGVGGPQMRSQGIQSLLQTEDFEVMGFTDVFLALPRLIKQFVLVRDHLLKAKPEVAIFIDYPGFNLRMADSLRRNGYKGKIVQYISPSVWAWGQHRIAQMAKTLDLLLTIFPFEKDYFVGSPLNVQFVGNPIKEYVKNYQYAEDWKDTLEIPESSPLIALFPGSRASEIKRHLSIQLEAAQMLKKDNPKAIFALSVGHSHTVPLLKNCLQASSLKLNRDIFLVPKEFSYEMMRDSHSAIAKSGTVTLELALHHRPTVVMYKASFINRILVKYLVRPNLSHFCIVNILGGREVFPELIAQGLSSENVCRAVKRLHENTNERQACLDACQDIHRSLEINNASERAALEIRKLMSC